MGGGCGAIGDGGTGGLEAGEFFGVRGRGDKGGALVSVRGGILVLIDDCDLHIRERMGFGRRRIVL